MRRTVFSLCFFGSALLFGCRNSSTTGSGGSGGGDASTGTKGTSATSTGVGGMGGQIGCDGEEHTIAELTSGTVGPGTKVSLKGVVAMSEKFNVSHSNSCLWGVFVSAPGLSETGPNTGILALSYGTPPMIPPGENKAYCPRLDQASPGDKFPDDVKPGDVLDLVGVTAYFPTMINCMPTDPQNTVPMRQLGQVCSATRTGTAPIPAAHLMTGGDLDSISSTTNTDFHDKWGGVKVRIENAPVVPQGTPPAVLDGFGNIVVAPNIVVSDKAFYWGYNPDACHAGPVYTDLMMVFNSIEGFHYLNFCDWELLPTDRCADFDPPSVDCVMGNPPMPITSCVGVK